MSHRTWTLAALAVPLLAPLFLAAPAMAAPTPITPAELQGLLQQHQRVLIADVRGPSAFVQRHIQGAVSVPRDRLAAWAKKAPKDALIVTYCACPHDESSTGAALDLADKYHHQKVRILKGGIDAWIAQGYPFSLAADSL